MRTCRCACGETLVLPDGPMELWVPPMLAHVRSQRHREWSRSLTPDEPVTIMRPHLYEEHLDQVLGMRT